MTNLAVVDKATPDQFLLRLYRQSPDFVASLLMRANARVNLSFSWYSPVERLKQALEENRSNLAALPNEADLEQLQLAAVQSLSRCTEKHIRREIAQLIGAFPNANPTDPETYIAALIFDLLDCQIPDFVLTITCQEIRRTSRFVPSIAEILSIARQCHADYRELTALADRVRRTRENLRYAAQIAERTLQHVLANGNKPPVGNADV